MTSPSSTWIVLFRGINVGGRARLAVKDLAAVLESLGLDTVRTYVQSGNAVLAATAEKLVGVPMTARNWRSVMGIRDLARQVYAASG